MSEEQDRAAFYDEHGNDDLWEDPEPAPVPAFPNRHGRKGRTETITVRFSAKEADIIRRIAREQRITYSEVIRRAIAAFQHGSAAQQDTVVRLYSGGESEQQSRGGMTKVQLESGDPMPYTAAPLVRTIR
jgi:hypothetical protein